MAGATNWLTFSLTPMEMLRSPDSQFVPYDTSSHCLVDNIYAKNGWTNSKDLMDSESENQPLVVPKMEDFFDNQTETQDDSSLNQIYGRGSASVYFSDQQDLNAIPGFQAFSSTNSGSELDDSASHKTRAAPGELGAESCKKTLSLCDVTHGSEDKAIVAVEFDTPKKVGHTCGQRTSIYRGVTRHRWTGRYEAHLWDNSCRREGQARKGRQVYLGGYDKEEKAARAYDLAALKYWGPTATTNFPISNYTKEIEEMKHAGKQEFIASLRRKSSGFSRGASAYRGVTRHHQQGRWQARIGRVAGNKDLYLGTFATEEEAAEAYDIAAIKFRGANAVTNFEMSRYDVEAILNSSLPVGGVTKRLKLSPESENKAPISSSQQPQCTNVSGSINFSSIQPVASIPYDSANTCYPHNLFHHFHPTNGGSSTAESAATVTNATTLTTPPPPAVPGFFIWPHQPY
ncbi:AP2 ethylene-responsive transcription factor AIL6 [Spatholobus suberectus]|nr:AP2 ethylene-responsive transcription factor AIL6 [Spatholobus suberectus]